MRPRPLSTRTYLKEISAALRGSQPPRHRRDWSILKYMLGLMAMACAIAGLFSLAAVPKFDMHDHEIIDPATYHAPEPEPWWIGQPVRAQLVRPTTIRIFLRNGQIISSSAQLPALGHPGDQYYDTSIGRWWVWGQPSGYAYATWIDP